MLILRLIFKSCVGKQSKRDRYVKNSSGNKRINELVIVLEKSFHIKCLGCLGEKTFVMFQQMSLQHCGIG